MSAPAFKVGDRVKDDEGHIGKVVGVWLSRRDLVRVRWHKGLSTTEQVDNLKPVEEGEVVRGYRRGRNDYDAITAEALDPTTEPVEVGADEYFEMLGCLPPIRVAGGFLISEPLTISEHGSVHANYAERSGRYLARYSVRGRPETYIKEDA